MHVVNALRLRERRRRLRLRGDGEALEIRRVVASLVASAATANDKDTTPKNDSRGSGNPEGRSDALRHARARTSSTYDLNHDNKPDVWRLYKTEDEGGTKVEFMTCKQVDFDHDGRKDWVVAYNRKGMPLFEKADFDYDGKWDMSAVFDTKTGLVAEVERDTDFDGRRRR